MFRCRRVGRIDNTHVAFRSITRHGEAERIKLPRRRMLIAHFVTLCLRRGRLRARRRPYGSGSGIHCVGTFAQVATTENHTSSASDGRQVGTWRTPIWISIGWNARKKLLKLCNLQNSQHTSFETNEEHCSCSLVTFVPSIPTCWIIKILDRGKLQKFFFHLSWLAVGPLSHWLTF